MFERFTDRSRRAVVFAQEEARLLRHSYIGTEHILLALLREGEGVGAKALEARNISLDAAREQVKEIIGRGKAPPRGHIPFTPRAKKVLELSLREALQDGHNYIGTEHILLGLLREGEGVAAEVLRNLGANLDSIRQTVVQLLSDYTAGASVGARLESASGDGPRCSTCAWPLEDALRYRRLLAAPVDEDEDPVSVRIFFCGQCGAILGSHGGDVEGLPPAAPGAQED